MSMHETTLVPAEQAFVAYVRQTTGARASTRVPHPLPAEHGFVIIRRAGGAPTNIVQTVPTLLVEVWGVGSSEEVRINPWELTKEVWESLSRAADVGSLPFGVEVSAVDLSEPSNYPDEATGTPRYTFILTPTVNTN